MSEAVSFTTFEEFLVGEEHAERRHEFVGGRIYAMAGGPERHDLAAGLLYERLAPGARQQGCRPFAGNRLVHTRSGSTYYPDVMVACHKAPHRLYETDPTLIIEVLSPSTADIDRREKTTAYAASEALVLLLLVDPDNRRIETAHTVNKWLQWDAYGPGDVIVTDYGDIDVDELDDQIDAVATTT